MVRIIKTCPRCGGVTSDCEYKLDPKNMVVPPIVEEPCENCRAEYEALMCRQAEERRLFWEGEDGED